LLAAGADFRSTLFRGALAATLAAALAFAALVSSARAADLRVMLDAAPVTLDPLLAADAAGVRISHQLLFETLLTLGETLRVEPGLAERWERRSPTRYRFHVRAGVRFASGAPLDARDAVATLERLLAADSRSPYGAPLRQKIARVRIVPAAGGAPPLAFDVDLRAPYASVLSDLIVPVVPRDADPRRPLDGSGPYRLASQAPGEVVLERSATFHGPRPALERIVFKTVQDENTRLLKFYKGDVDLGINVMPLDKLALFAKPPLAARFDVVEGPGLSFEYLGFNCSDPLLADRRVREAIAHALDVDGMIRYRQRGHAVRAVSLLPPGSPDAWPGAPPAHDPAWAERLLDEAGHPRRFGTRFALEYKTSTDRAALARARIVRHDLGQVGIEVNIRSFEFATFFDDIQKGNFQLYALRWIGVSDPAFLAEVLLSDRMPPEGRNRGRYRNGELDGLLRAALVEPDDAKRADLYRRADRLAQAELPYLPLWHNDTVAIVSKRFAGFRLHPSGGFQSLPAMRETGGVPGK
jgi:peptide/nickel transport system substrate-binding protein